MSGDTGGQKHKKMGDKIFAQRINNSYSYKSFTPTIEPIQLYARPSNDGSIWALGKAQPVCYPMRQWVDNLSTPMRVILTIAIIANVVVFLVWL